MENKIPSNLVIRPAQLEDVSAVVAGINAVCAEEIYFRTTQFVSDPQWAMTFEQLGDNTERLVLVADLNDSIVGMVNIFPGSTESRDAHAAELGIHVLAPFRDRGVGTQLLRTALDWARDRKIEKITLSVFSTNSRALYLYAKFGFEREGVRRKQYRIRGEYVDDILMAKFL